MEVKFILNSEHKLILSVLNVADDIDIFTLRKTLISLHCGEISFSALVKVISKDDVINIIPPPEVYDYFQNPKGGRSEFENDVANLEYVGLAKVEGYFDFNNRPFGRICLTDDGKRIAKNIKESRQIILRPKSEFRTSVFVACAFGYNEIDLLYENQFIPAAKSLSYTPVRVDMSEPTKTITEAILDGITESTCLIADLTHARPSVYFEVGYTHGLGIPLLLTCRKDHYRGTEDKARIHFDLEQYK